MLFFYYFKLRGRYSHQKMKLHQFIIVKAKNKQAGVDNY